MSQAVPKSRSRSNSPAPKSRSRSASPVRKVKPETESAPKQVVPFPALAEYIERNFGKAIAKFVNWNMWQERVESFIQGYRPDLWAQGSFNFSILAYFFAQNSFDFHYGSCEVQAIVNAFCTRDQNNGGRGQEFLNGINDVHNLVSPTCRPGGLNWVRGWSRLVRHMNQGIPLVKFSGGQGFAEYHSIFKDTDAYNGYVIPDGLSFRSMDPVDLAFELAREANESHARVVARIAPRPKTWTQITEDVVLWNFSLVTRQGFVVPDDLFGAKENPSTWNEFRQTLVANDNFKVEQVATTRIGFQEKKKPQ